MPRKLCTMWNDEPCRTNYDPTKNFVAEKGTVYRFPKPPEQDGWVRSLPIILPSNLYDDKGVLSRTIGVCAKHKRRGQLSRRRCSEIQTVFVLCSHF